LTCRMETLPIKGTGGLAQRDTLKKVDQKSKARKDFIHYNSMMKLSCQRIMVSTNFKKIFGGCMLLFFASRGMPLTFL